VKFGTNVISETVTKVDFSSKPFKLWVEDAEDGEPAMTADTVIIATGATARRMNLPGEDTYWQQGISACAVCDGAAPIFKNKTLICVGGGDSACEEATYLTKYASKVVVLVRRDVLRASKVMGDRLKKHPKVEIMWNTNAVECKGNGKLLTAVTVKNNKTGEVKDVECGGLFYAIGHVPNTKPFEGIIDLDEEGYIKVAPGTTQTNIPGVFASGDVMDKKYRQAITAAGTGCMAALDAEHFLAAME